MCRIGGCLLVVVWLICCCTVARANDGGVSGVGGTVQMLHPEHSSVRMVSEEVHAVLGRAGPKVRCTFVFKNEGPATTVKMGFPEAAGGADADPNSKVSSFRGFRSWVDGKLVTTQLVPSTKNTDQTFKAWHVKDVRFEAGQMRTVRDEYIGGMGGDISGASYFEYTLRSGASWKGRIGRALITVDAGNLLDTNKITRISPKNYTRHGRLIRWVLSDFEPTQDVHIGFEPSVRFAVDGNPVWLRHYGRKDGSTFYYSGALGALNISSQRNGRACTLTYREHTLAMVAGSKTAVLDKTKKITLPVAPFLTRGSMVVPIAPVVRAFGGTARHWTDKEGFYHLDIKLPVAR